MFEAIQELKRPTALQVVGWWELRRIVYNAILLVVLPATYLGILEVAGSHLPPGQDAIEPMAFFFFIPQYFLIVNACYSLGWIVDLLLRKFRVEVTLGLRSRAFWAGMAVSCIVTSVPFWWSCIYWLGKPVVPQ